jgi:hypothetical protein
MEEEIIKEVKKHSFYLKPGEKKRVKQALARKRRRKRVRREPLKNESSQPTDKHPNQGARQIRVYCFDGKKNLRWKYFVSNYRI